ncbi:MAG: hypothetical protein HQL91_10775 [Magnetococcales bacterium]|nr:hypothetical protein [Magnetococcales bacterium]
MFRSFVWGAILGMAWTGGAWAAGGGGDPNLLCERYAQEDGVPPHKMAEFLNQCMRDQLLDRVYEEEAADRSSDNEPLEENLAPGPPPPAPAKADSPAKSAAKAPAKHP